MPKIAEWEILACALAVVRQHGDNSALQVAERIGTLAVAGDMQGVEVWKALAARMDSLSGGRGRSEH